jgi:hypothetical protein
MSVIQTAAEKRHKNVPNLAEKMETRKKGCDQWNKKINLMKKIMA